MLYLNKISIPWHSSAVACDFINSSEMKTINSTIGQYTVLGKGVLTAKVPVQMHCGIRGGIKAC